METIFLPEHPAIPGYEPVKVLGRNGSIIYLARRVSSGEQVALIVTAHAQYADKLRAYVPLLLNLNHPNVLRAYEIAGAKGWTYAATEYVSGTLADKLADRPLPAAEAVRMTRTLALTLGYIRNHRMAHPDLRPKNILLTDNNNPKLHDLHPTDVVEKWNVQERLRSVELAFSAPEGLTGENLASVGADVYRVGATMYAMLTGHPPFAGDVKRPSEIGTMVLEKPPTPLRQRNAAVPKEVEAVCLLCLEKRPEHRYASLQELADVLARLKED